MNGTLRAPFGRLPGPIAQSAARTLQHVTEVLTPHEGIYDIDLEDRVLATVLRFVPYMAAPVRLSFPFGLLLVEFGAPLFGFGFARFRSMERDRAVEYLERIGRGAEPFRLLHDGLRALSLIAYYQQPEIMAVLEVDWATRSEELIARRAELMMMEPALANPRNMANPGGDEGGTTP